MSYGDLAVFIDRLSELPPVGCVFLVEPKKR
jgi:hypothetical protein